MKKAVMVLIFLTGTLAYAADYYVSSSGNDSADGLSPSTAWKSISKVNSAFSGLSPGDRILFKKGDRFAGTLQPARSGISGNPITIGAYGTGANPVITGFTVISGWISYGNGIYYKSLSCQSFPNMVTVNDVNTPIGKWPNSGYLSVDSHVSNTSISDSELPSYPDWTGAEAVIRKVPYIWDRDKITDHSGSTISYSSSSDYTPKDGLGYFIQNALATLDQQGEWYYNGNNFYMYFDNNPDNYVVKVSSTDQLAVIDNRSYITLDNIAFEGANTYGIQIKNSEFVTIQNCNINFTGKTAIFGPWWGSSSNCKINSNTIANSNNSAISLSGDFANATVSGNTIRNTGLLIGMGESGDGTYTAVAIRGENSTVQYNTIENTGYVAINFAGNNIQVTNNLVNTFNLVKNDGGGIYTYVGTGTSYTGQKISGNIVLNGKGYGDGLPDKVVHACGIYMDDRVRNVSVINNTVADCSSTGMYLHNAHEIEISGNTFYNNGSARPDFGGQVLFVHDSYSPDDPIRNIKMNNNIFFAAAESEVLIAFCTSENDFSSFGTADYNGYARPLNNEFIARTWSAGWNSTAIMRSLSNWQSFTGQDKNSYISPLALTDAGKIRFEYNASGTNRVVDLDGSYIDVKGKKYSGSITIPPYSSVVLMVDPDPATPPETPLYVSSSIENAAPSVIEMTYNLTLANIVPSASAFTVQVNSVGRTVSSVSISGTKVRLTLSSPVAYGNTISVAYTKPAANPLQTPAGGEAASLTSRSVTNRVSEPLPPPAPVFVSAVIENATPSRLEITYNLTLASIVPAASAFTVQVNSSARAVSSVSVSGAKVLLTLASPVAYGNTITISYTKPSANPLQTPAGGQAASVTGQSVTNRVSAPPPPPVFVNAEIENATPSRLEITYSLTLANIVPTSSAFSVQVNSSVRTVSSVSISGAKVLLTLASPVAYGNTVTVSYTKPSANPLQTPAGGQAVSVTGQSVTNRVSAPPPPPVFVSAAIENATPSRLEITYSLTLANIVPASSAFSVQVNSSVRTVSSVSISGTKLLLTLAGPVAYGNTITISYTKPSANPLQTPAGGQAASVTGQSVTNRVSAPPPPPVFVSAEIENATPSRLEITYSLTLASIVPAASAFSVQVNSSVRPVSSVSISGTKVLLTLDGPVAYGNTVTVSYTKPSANPLQTPAGGQAASVTGQSVTNRVSAPPPPVVTPPAATPNTPPVVLTNYQSKIFSGFEGVINAAGSYDTDNDHLTYSWVAPSNVPVSSVSGSSIRYLSPVVETSRNVEFILKVSDGKTTQSKVLPVEILPYRPALKVAEVIKVEASGFQSPFYPVNTIDGDIGTFWSANGDEQWIILELKEPFNIQHIKLAFQPGLTKEAYFDILGSEDKLTWDPILPKSKSCAFSGNLQVFDFPPSKTSRDYKYIKLVGRGNAIDDWNYIAEFRMFGLDLKNPPDFEKQIVKIYPNPARTQTNILIKEQTFMPDFIRIVNLSGKIIYQNKLDPGIREFQLPISFRQGFYIVEIGTGSVTGFTQKLVVE